MLTIIPTPIGNLNDITLRAIEKLKAVDELLVEDSRVSGKLLNHLNITKKMTPFHAHNEHKKLEFVVEKMKQGIHFGLISDAGTPGISDPGFLIVRECIKEKIKIECLPGPTAFVPALVLSGLPTDQFYFEGFLPRKKGRLTKLKELSKLPCTIIIYESPYRVVKTLKEIKVLFGERQISVCRELTKKFEETLHGTISEIITHFENKDAKGEFVICIGKENY